LDFLDAAFVDDESDSDDDLAKGLPFWKLQHRPQRRITETVDDAVGSPSPSRSRTLAVITTTGLAGVDAFSDVNTALSSRLLNSRPCSTISAQHLDGSTQFKTEGEFLVGTSNGNPVHVTCCSASLDQLPDAMTAMFGMPAIATLGLSLDFIMVFPP
jgi:hypothetical protein